MQDDIKQWVQEVDAYKALHGQPYLDAANQNDKDAVEIAKLLIQSLLLLHGGALLAIPAFFSIRPGMSHDTLISLLACFSLGVFGALFAGLCAFFALAERSEGYSLLREAVDQRAWARVANFRFMTTQNSVFRDCETASNTAADSIDQTAKPHFKRYLLFRLVGIILVLSSVAALVFASIMASRAL